jgi:hypothetical protein
MWKTLSENEIEEYISENADKTLRHLQAEIRDNFNESKSLKWISKVKQKHEVANLETEEDDIEHAPEIIGLKKKLRQKQLEKEILMADADIEEIGELKEQNNELESDNNLLRKNLDTAMKETKGASSEVRKLRNTPCPTCAGKYIIKINNGYYCSLCGSYAKEGHPLRRY